MQFDSELRFQNSKYPPLPPLRQLVPKQEQVCAAIACDIDHTLINQAMAVLPHTSWAHYFPPVPDNMLDLPSVKTYSRKLRSFLQANTSRVLRVQWYDKACEPKTLPPHQDVLSEVIKHLTTARAIAIAPLVRIQPLSPLCPEASIQYCNMWTGVHTLFFAEKRATSPLAIFRALPQIFKPNSASCHANFCMWDAATSCP